jgi:hypothetical protein
MDAGRYCHGSESACALLNKHEPYSVVSSTHPVQVRGDASQERRISSGIFHWPLTTIGSWGPFFSNARNCVMSREELGPDEWRGFARTLNAWQHLWPIDGQQVSSERLSSSLLCEPCPIQIPIYLEPISSYIAPGGSWTTGLQILPAKTVCVGPLQCQCVCLCILNSGSFSQQATKLLETVAIWYAMAQWANPRSC